MANELSLVQWNCRGFKNKRNALHQWILSLPRKPDILLLQETGKQPTLPGYNTFQTRDQLALLIINALPANLEHDTDNSITISIQTTEGPLYITNVYSPPKDNLPELEEIIRPKTTRSAYEHLLAGDFNAPHRAWGYSKDSKKGCKLLCALQQAGYTNLQ